MTARSIALGIALAALAACSPPDPAVDPAVPVAAGAVPEAACAEPLARVPVDTARSEVRWRGTKFGGRGQHEGALRLASGTVALCAGRVVGGEVVVAMRSLVVTDIPASDPVPRRRLRAHLLSPDFFAADSFPTATFRLDAVEPLAGDSVQAAGRLTLRGRTQGLGSRAFVQSGDSVRVRAAFSIDRQRWGVAYRGSSLTNDLVDDRIALWVRVQAVRP